MQFIRQTITIESSMIFAFLCQADIYHFQVTLQEQQEKVELVDEKF